MTPRPKVVFYLSCTQRSAEATIMGTALLNLPMTQPQSFHQPKNNMLLCPSWPLKVSKSVDRNDLFDIKHQSGEQQHSINISAALLFQRTIKPCMLRANLNKTFTHTLEYVIVVSMFSVDCFLFFNQISHGSCFDFSTFASLCRKKLK